MVCIHSDLSVATHTLFDVFELPALKAEPQDLYRVGSNLVSGVELIFEKGTISFEASQGKSISRELQAVNLRNAL